MVSRQHDDDEGMAAIFVPMGKGSSLSDVNSINQLSDIMIIQ